MSKKQSAQNIAEGLEVSTASEQVATDATVQTELTLGWFQQNKPTFVAEFVSSKFDEEREVRVQAGLATISELVGDKINPLVIELARYWEEMPKRKLIKQLIDAEAAALHLNKDAYLQVKLRENVERLAEIATAIDRMKYAINYFKPREGIKVQTRQIVIDGISYIIDVEVAAEAKIKFADDREALKAYIIQHATVNSDIEVL